MDQNLSNAIEADDALEASRNTTTPTLGVAAIRFVFLLTAIVGIFVWAWSR